MRTVLASLIMFSVGAVSGGASVHTAYTSATVAHIEAMGRPMAYSDADRRALRSVIRSETIRARRRGLP